MTDSNQVLQGNTDPMAQQFTFLSMPSIIVTRADGASFGANHLSMEIGGKDNNQPVLSFICSGTRTVILASQVRSIEYFPMGRGYCTECDNPLNRLVPAASKLEAI